MRRQQSVNRVYVDGPTAGLDVRSSANSRGRARKVVASRPLRDLAPERGIQAPPTT